MQTDDGEYPSISLAEAREKAALVKRLAREGTHPAEMMRAQAPPAVPKVKDLIDRYVTEHLGRNLKAGGNVEKLLRRHVLSRWGERELTSIARGDLVSLLEEVRRPQPVAMKGTN